MDLKIILSFYFISLCRFAHGYPLCFVHRYPLCNKIADSSDGAEYAGSRLLAGCGLGLLSFDAMVAYYMLASTILHHAAALSAYIDQFSAAFRAVDVVRFEFEMFLVAAALRIPAALDAFVLEFKHKRLLSILVFYHKSPAKTQLINCKKAQKSEKTYHEE